MEKLFATNKKKYSQRWYYIPRWRRVRRDATEIYEAVTGYNAQSLA